MYLFNKLRDLFNTLTWLGNVACREYWGVILTTLFLFTIALTAYFFWVKPKKKLRVTALVVFILAIIFGLAYTVDSVINFGQDVIEPVCMSLLPPTIMFGIYSVYTRYKPIKVVPRIGLALLFGVPALFYNVFFIGMTVFAISIYGLVNWG